MTIIWVAAFEHGKNGALLFSRQFMPIQKSRLDALLYAFPKLHHLHTQEQPFIDSDSVRYVLFQAYEVTFILITNKQSNLITDLSLLQLISRTVYTVCYPEHYEPRSQTDNSSLGSNPLSPSLVKSCLFEIFIALDEIVEYGGYPTEINSTLESIHTALLMDSHEEHRYNLQQAGKMKEAKMKSAQKARELEKQRKFGPSGNNDPAMAGRIVGIGSHSFQSSSSSSSQVEPDSISSHQSNNSSSSTTANNSSSSSSSSSSAQSHQSNLGFDGSKLQFSSNQPATAITATKTSTQTSKIGGARKLGGKGKMVLGKKQQQAPEPEEQPQPEPQSSQPTSDHPSSSQQPLPTTSTPAIQAVDITIPHVKTEEHVQIQIDSENSLLQLSIQGKLSLLLPSNSTSTSTNYAVQLNPINNIYPSLLKSQTRPGLDKTQWASNSILYNTDINKPFLIGPDKPNILLQWKLLLTGNSLGPSQQNLIQELIPFQFTHWVSSNSPNSTTVSIECSPSEAYVNSHSASSLQHIIIAIPCPSRPSLSQVDKPWKYDQDRQILYWSLGSLSTNNHQITSTPQFSSSSIEFEVNGSFEQENFLPMSLSLSPQQSYVGIAPIQMYDTAVSQPVEFGTQWQLTVDSFTVTNGQ